MGRYHFVFPPWANLIVPTAVVIAAIAPLYVIYVVAYGFSPMTTAVGYQPKQPVAFSHAIHAGQLGMDCRYCHNTVEYSPRASVPPTQTCMGCHTQIHAASPKLEPVWASYETGNPIEWIRVHDLPDFAYFDHSAHVARGVSCVECHGRIDRMEVVYQHAPLSMSWCLECHRDPEPRLRNPAEVTNLAWDFDATDHAQTMTRREYGSEWKRLHQLNPTQDCSACHR
jgi:menaquinone reductase, multiheme cytochrome c subunit